MSPQQQFSASNEREPLSETAGPDCPQCHGTMTVRQLSPAVSASDVDEVVYGCARCGTELKRDIKRT